MEKFIFADNTEFGGSEEFRTEIPAVLVDKIRKTLYGMTEDNLLGGTPVFDLKTREIVFNMAEREAPGEPYRMKYEIRIKAR